MLSCTWRRLMTWHDAASLTAPPRAESTIPTRRSSSVAFSCFTMRRVRCSMYGLRAYLQAEDALHEGILARAPHGARAR